MGSDLGASGESVPGMWSHGKHSRTYVSGLCSLLRDHLSTFQDLPETSGPPTLVGGQTPEKQDSNAENQFNTLQLERTQPGHSCWPEAQHSHATPRAAVRAAVGGFLISPHTKTRSSSYPLGLIHTDDMQAFSRKQVLREGGGPEEDWKNIFKLLVFVGSLNHYRSDK